MGDLLARMRQSLAAGGIDVFAVIPAARWDAAGPPAELASAALLPGARSVIVVGSGGRALWERLCSWIAEDPAGRLEGELHPLDRYVRERLAEGERLLGEQGIRARRLEPTLSFQPRVDFRRLASAAGLGANAPIGMIVHPLYGPWWSPRGAWLVDRELPSSEPAADDGRPCAGCPAPCRAAIPAGAEGTLYAATRAAREACLLGDHRYGEEQLTYHYRPAEGRALLTARLGRA